MNIRTTITNDNSNVVKDFTSLKDAAKYFAKLAGMKFSVPKRDSVKTFKSKK